MTFERFKEFCINCWKQKYGFVVIDKDSESIGRYRKGFDQHLKWC